MAIDFAFNALNFVGGREERNMMGVPGVRTARNETE